MIARWLTVVLVSAVLTVQTASDALAVATRFDSALETLSDRTLEAFEASGALETASPIGLYVERFTVEADIAGETLAPEQVLDRLFAALNKVSGNRFTRLDSAGAPRSYTLTGGLFADDGPRRRITLTFSSVLGERFGVEAKFIPYEPLCDTYLSRQLEERIALNNEQFFAALQDEVSGAVTRSWSSAGVDAAFAEGVYAEAERINSQGTGWDRFWRNLGAGLVPKQAQEHGQTMLSSSLEADEMERALVRLGTEVTNRLIPLISLQTETNFLEAIQCFQGYLSSEYDARMVDVFSAELNGRIERGELADVLAEAPPDAPAEAPFPVLSATGAGLLIVQQIGRRVGQRVASRVTSKLGTRVIGRAIPIVSVVLIGLDVWDAYSGGPIREIAAIVADTPEIEAELQSVTAEVTAEEVQRSFEESTAEILIALRREYVRTRETYDRLWKLADDRPALDRLMSTLDGRELVRLSVLRQTVDEQQFFILVDAGDARRAVKLPDADFNAFLKIMAESNDAALGGQWLAKAGRGLARIVDSGLYQRLPIETMERATLQRLIAIEDEDLFARAAALPLELLDTLTLLSDAELSQVLVASGGVPWNEGQRLANMTFTALIAPQDKAFALARLQDRDLVNWIVRNAEAFEEAPDTTVSELIEQVETLTLWSAPLAYLDPATPPLVKDFILYRYQATWIGAGIGLGILILALFVALARGGRK